MIRLALTVAMFVLPVQAQTPMTASEFEDYVTGRTLTFGVGGQAYGVEEFRAGRRTTWAFLQEECREGRWFPRGEQICFVYKDFPNEAHCWIFRQSDEGLIARAMGDDATELYEVQQSPDPLVCAGPKVGV